jgi:hypothetical protein
MCTAINGTATSFCAASSTTTGAIKVATTTQLAVVGRPVPSTRQIKPVSTSMMTKFPADRNSTISVMTRPMPVNVTVPTIMPAVAVAMPTAVILRAPDPRPARNSPRPSRS